jgi:LEA14-like dessication related protein
MPSYIVCRGQQSRAQPGVCRKGIVMEHIGIRRHRICVFISLALICAGCKTMQETLSLKRPTARLTGLKFEDVKLDSATLLFDVEIDNHYPVALPLTNFDYTLSSRGEKFLLGSVNSQAIVPAESKKTIALPAKINYVQMLKALRGIKPGSRIPYKADLDLSVDTPALGSLKLPLRKEGELVLPNVSDIDVKDIWELIRSDK